MAFTDSPQSLFVGTCGGGGRFMLTVSDVAAKFATWHRYLGHAGIHLCCQKLRIYRSMVRNEQKLSGVGP